MRYAKWSGLAFLFVVSTGFVVYRYFFVVPPALIASITDSTPISDDHLKEFGDTNNPRFKPAIDLYLADLKTYTKMEMDPISPSDNEQQDTERAKNLYTLLSDKLQHDSKSAKLLDVEDGDFMVQQLAKHISLMLLRTAGLSNEEYLKVLGNPKVHLPEASTRFEFFASEYAPSVTPIAKDPSKAQEVFDTYDASIHKYRDDSNRVVGWTINPEGILAAIDESEKPCNELEGHFIQLDSTRLSKAEQQLFNGGVTQGAVVFTNDLHVKAGTYLRSEVRIVVQTNGNDYYPFTFHSYYDPADKQWHLIYANRSVSMRMSTSPSPAF